MKALIRQARIICPGSEFHGLLNDISISSGSITEIGKDLRADGHREISLPDLHVCPGWMDIFSLFGEPGFEYRETISSGCSAAAAGGFTDVLLMPNTFPAASTRSQIEYVLNKSSSLPVTLHPAGTVTRECSGKELSEMYDLHAGGAIAFSDGIRPVQDSDMILKALQYVKSINGVIIQIPDDKSIQPGGLINEGVMSTRLGLPGKAPMGEEIMVSRCIDLLRYTGSRIHITGITTAKSAELIRRAKAEGLDISCSVTPYHLHFTDEDLCDYDTNLKVDPPLRSKDQRESLRQALRDGTIDCISSHHMPLHTDEKLCEFEKAVSGMSGLESCFGAVSSIIDDTEKMITMMYAAPRKILGLELPEIKAGAKACLTLFNPDAEFTFEENMILSSSRNNAFKGKTLKGKVFGIVNKNQIILNHS